MTEFGEFFLKKHQPNHGFRIIPGTGPWLVSPESNQAVAGLELEGVRTRQQGAADGHWGDLGCGLPSGNLAMENDHFEEVNQLEISRNQ